MANIYNLKKGVNSDYNNVIDEIQIPQKNTDGATGVKETTWSFNNFSKWNGIFYSIPDVQSALIMKSIWNTGKGFDTDIQTRVILDHITGWGKDTFEDILFNLDLTSMIGGDSFAEIIKDDNELINLKVLDPSSISVVCDDKGIIIRYEQTIKVSKDQKIVKKFEPNQIFHLSNNRYADNIHGLSSIEALEETIKADNESFEIMKKVMRFQARPFILWKLKTDDEVTIRDFVQKIEKARGYGEDTFIPDDENAVSFEVIQLNINNAIFDWRNDIRTKYYRNVGLPQIVPGASGNSTESESKVIYTAFGQIVQQRQKFIERQFWLQLQIRISLKHPDSFFEDLKNDASKDGTNAFQLNDIVAGSGK
jgi:hypothetical protein